jgi:serine phosphatase RsbU (regulator of sigma subunit)
MTAAAASYVETPRHACYSLARALQRTLVPPISFENGRMEVYGRTTPHDTFGGDLSDLVASDSDAVAYVADVSGHDVSSGMLMGMVKTAARYGLMAGQTLPDLLQGINRVLPSVKEPNMYATFAGVRLRAPDEMEYIIAGNMPVLHYRSGCRDVIRLAMEQFPLGLFPEASYTSSLTACGPGDLIAIFTDGLVETAEMRDELGLQRLEEVLRKNEGEPLLNIHAAAVEAVGGEQADDRTLMLVRLLA